MKKVYILLSCLPIAFATNAQVNVGITGTVGGVYINEFHYDNTGTDAGEFIEVAGPAGTDLSTYFITLYNGDDIIGYNSYAGTALSDPYQLSGIIDDEAGGYGAVVFFIGGIQNGNPNPDGMALSRTGTTDVQFLSYEGTFVAANGAASGLLSVDVGLVESGATPAGYSLEYDEGTTAWIVSPDDTPGDFVQGNILSNDDPEAYGFAIYPNPVVGGKVTITTTKNAAKQVTIYDVLGKPVLTQTLADKVLDVSSLQAGVYIIKITEDKKTTTRKLVIK